MVKDATRLKGCFMSNSDHWKTPKAMYDWFVGHVKFYDPCPYHCDSFDGLSVEWPNNTFCNPPYSEIDKWVDKAIEEHKKDISKNILLLVPARTDTKWFLKLVRYASKIQFIVGRLHFNDDKNSAPFPSCLVQLYWSRQDYVRCEWIDRSYWESLVYEPK